jgi:hypothetical protein
VSANPRNTLNENLSALRHHTKNAPDGALVSTGNDDNIIAGLDPDFCSVLAHFLPRLKGLLEPKRQSS